MQRGVETLNSVKDPREIYFRNRLNALMMKPSVVKTLSADKKDRKDRKDKAREEAATAESAMGTFKKGELEMKLTYAKEDHSEEKLRSMVSTHNVRIEEITGAVESTMTNSRKRLEDRISQRRLKSATARERSLATNDEKADKLEKNNLEVLDEIQEEQEERAHQHAKAPKKKRRHSLDLKEMGHYHSVIVEPLQVRRVSLLLPSRKQSE